MREPEMLTLADFLAELRRLQGDSEQRTLAISLGVSPQYLNDILNGRRLPGEKILAPMGLAAETYYRKVRSGKGKKR
jgi:hypothetical protein